MNDNKDAFDLWWEWAEKPLDSPLTIDAEIHEAVMALSVGRMRIGQGPGRFRGFLNWPQIPVQPVNRAPRNYDTQDDCG
jgi:hypothetical protein